jgi:hypothetical protein
MSETLYYCPCCGRFYRNDMLCENVECDDADAKLCRRCEVEG